MRKPIRHAGGTIQRTEFGTWGAVYNRDGKRLRKTCKTQEAAREWLDLKAAESRLAIDPASPTEMADAAEARRLLDGQCSLTEAARFWLRSTGTLSPLSTRDAIAKYIDLRERDNLRDSSIQSIRHRLLPLAARIGDTPMHLVTTDDLGATQRGSAMSRNNARRYYMMLWAWALKKHHVLSNVAAALTMAKADESLPEALDVDQVITLLQTTRRDDPALMPWLCAGLFSGLRVAELARVGGEHFKGGKLHLDPTVTKLRDRRILDLLYPLPDWLAAFPPSGPLLQTNHRKRFEALREAAGLTSWPNNALRHSFATYHLSAYQDAAKTAHYTRHESQDTLHRHYIDLATHEDAILYFNLGPGTLDFLAESRGLLGRISAS